MDKRRPRSREMAVDRVGAACAVGPLHGDHRQRDMRTRMTGILGHRGGESDRCAVLHGEQATHALGVGGTRTSRFLGSWDQIRRPHRMIAHVVGDQPRDSRGLRADFGNGGGLPLLTLTDRPEADDAGDRCAGLVDEAADVVETHTDAARVHRSHARGQQIRPQWGTLQGSPIPCGAGCNDHRIAASAN